MGLIASLGASQARPDDEQNQGFIGNLIGDVGEIAKGFGTFLGGALHDVGAIIPTAMGNKPAEGFVMDDLVKMLPGAVWEDLKYRYGPLFEGEIGEFGQRVHQDPLFFLTDVLGGASVAQRAVQRFAPEATRSVRLVEAAQRLRRASEMGGVTPQVMSGAAPWLEAADAVPAGVRRLGPLAYQPRRFTYQGLKLRDTPGIQNPITRGIANRVERRFFSQPTDVVRQKVLDMSEAEQLSMAQRGIHGLTDLELEEMRQGQRMVDQAVEAGVPHITKGSSLGLAMLGREGGLARVVDRLYGRFKHHRDEGLRQGHLDYGDEIKEMEVTDAPAFLEEIRGKTEHALDATRTRMRVEMPEPGALPQVGASAEELAAAIDLAQDAATVNRYAAELVSMYDDGVKLLEDIAVRRGADMSPGAMALKQWVGDGVKTGTRTPILQRMSRALAPHIRRLRTQEDALRTVSPKDLVSSLDEYEAARLHVAHLIRTGLDPSDDLMSRAYRSLAFWVDENLTHPLVHEGRAYSSILRTRFDPLRRQGIEEWYAGKADSFEAAMAGYRKQMREVGERKRILADALTGKARKDAVAQADAEIAQIAQRKRILADAHKKATGGDPSPPPPYVDREGNWIDTPGSSPMELARLYDEQGLRAPIYFPEVHAGKASSARLMWNNPGARHLGVSRPGGRFQRQGRIAEPWLDTRIEDAYMRRLSEEVTLREMREMLAELGHYGRRIDDVREVGPGEQLVIPDYLLRMTNNRRVIIDQYLAHIEDAVDPAEALGKVVDEFMPNMSSHAIAEAEKFVQQLRGGVEKAVEIRAVPKIAARRLEKHMTRLFGGSIGFQIGWDSPMAAWRAIVLSGRPNWILNNVIGNTVFLLSHGGRLRDVVRQVPMLAAKGFEARFPGLAETIRRMDEAYITQLEKAMGHNITEIESGAFFRTTLDTGSQLSPAARLHPLGKAMTKASKSRAVEGLRTFSDYMRNFNSEIEDAFRRAAYLSGKEKALIRTGSYRNAKEFVTAGERLRKLAEQGIDEVSGRDALDAMNLALNDYRTMHPLGAQVVRRFIAPFWGFYRHMIRLLVTMPFEHAAQFDILRAMSEVGREIMEELGPVPDYAESAFPVGPGEDLGTTQFLSSRSGNPFEGLTDPARWLTLLSPGLKIALEQATGRSLFTGDPFTSPGVETPYGFSEPFGVEVDENGQPVDSSWLPGGVRPNLLDHILSQIPHYDLAKDVLAGGRTHDTATLWGVLGDRIMGEEPEGLIASGGQPVFPMDPLQGLSRLFGFSRYDVDLNSFQRRLAEGERAALAAAIRDQ